MKKCLLMIGDVGNVEAHWSQLIQPAVYFYQHEYNVIIIDTPSLGSSQHRWIQYGPSIIRGTLQYLEVAQVSVFSMGLGCCLFLQILGETPHVLSTTHVMYNQDMPADRATFPFDVFEVEVALRDNDVQIWVIYNDDEDEDTDPRAYSKHNKGASRLGDMIVKMQTLSMQWTRREELYLVAKIVRMNARRSDGLRWTDVFAMADLGCSLAGLPLSCCILNASGPRTNTEKQLIDIARSSSGAVCSKSATLKPREGNAHPRYVELASGESNSSVNSEGLPNAGVGLYTDVSMLQRLKENAAPSSKPYILSISGLSLDENLSMLDGLLEHPDAIQYLSAVEVNVACPNVPGKPLVGYDFPQLSLVVEKIASHEIFSEPYKVALGFKLPPYFDAPFFDAVAAMLNPKAKSKGGALGYVVCCNTVGGALAVDVDSESTVLHPKGGFGGMGGHHVRLIALGNVRQFRERLDGSIDIVGCGGVSTGEDAFAHILCGATAVQVATQHRVEGAGCFARIAAELQALMQRKGYRCLDDFRGKLQVQISVASLAYLGSMVSDETARLESERRISDSERIYDEILTTEKLNTGAIRVEKVWVSRVPIHVFRHDVLFTMQHYLRQYPSSVQDDVVDGLVKDLLDYFREDIKEIPELPALKPELLNRSDKVRRLVSSGNRKRLELVQESMLALTAPQQAALPGKVEEKVETLALSRRGTGSKLAAKMRSKSNLTVVSEDAMDIDGDLDDEEESLVDSSKDYREQWAALQPIRRRAARKGSEPLAIEAPPVQSSALAVGAAFGEVESQLGSMDHVPDKLQNGSLFGICARKGVQGIPDSPAQIWVLDTARHPVRAYAVLARGLRIEVKCCTLDNSAVPSSAGVCLPSLVEELRLGSSPDSGRLSDTESWQAERTGKAPTIEEQKTMLKTLMGEGLVEADAQSDPSTDLVSEASDLECSDSQSDDEPHAFYTEDTVLIFDWDDTMLPSSWLSEQSLSLDEASHISSEQEAQLAVLAQTAAKTLRVAKRYGKVVLVTNAECGWIELSCQKFMPSLYPHLEDVTLFSARSTYENQGMAAPFQWKYLAFETEICNYYESLTSDRLKNVISFGDSFHEREAVIRVTERLKNCCTKTLKFTDRPIPELLLKEHALIQGCFKDIVSHDGSLDLCFTCS
ncbi:URA1 [Symbiodinium microadriaticum]|nr:URA1 [Symbiodinium microadriaticum]